LCKRSRPVDSSETVGGHDLVVIIPA
jgi:hypothetical protein